MGSSGTLSVVAEQLCGCRWEDLPHDPTSSSPSTKSEGGYGGVAQIHFDVWLGRMGGEGERRRIKGGREGERTAESEFPLYQPPLVPVPQSRDKREISNLKWSRKIFS
jgi:hypothetical protein